MAIAKEPQQFPAARKRGISSRHALWDAVFMRVTQSAALLVVGVLVLVFVSATIKSWPAIHRFGFAFISGKEWDPVGESFGAWPFIWGTLYTSAIGLALSVPVGVACAVFLSELSPPWLTAPVSFLVELLAAIPSVVYGLWGVLVMVPWLTDHVETPLSDLFGNLPVFAGSPYGPSFLAAGVILAIMVLPIITAITRDVLRAVPKELRQASLALGSNRWETIWRVVIPAGRTGIVGGIILALGRALGETMAVTMVIGNRPEASVSLLNPGYTMASVLANEFTEATKEIHRASLEEITLLLFLLTVLVNALARWMVWRMNARMGGGKTG